MRFAPRSLAFALAAAASWGSFAVNPAHAVTFTFDTACATSGADYGKTPSNPTYTPVTTAVGGAAIACGVSNPSSSYDGNVRYFNGSEGISVRAAAWSFTGDRDGGSNNAAQIAWLGQWLDTAPPPESYGLGVTNTEARSGATGGGDGDGANAQHTMDNVGRYDFITFLFNRKVSLGQILLDAFAYGSLGPDSDITVYMGNIALGTDAAVYTAINNKLLNEIILGANLGGPIHNNVDTGTNSADRWANFGSVPQGNFLIVMASTASQSDRDDMIKIAALKVYKAPEPGTLALFGFGLLGLAGFGALRRRRREKS